MINKKICTNNIKRLLILIVMGITVLTTTISVFALGQEVYIKDGDKTISIYSLNTDTEKILSRAGIILKEEDKVIRAEENGKLILEIKRAFSVKILDDGNLVKELMICEGTVEDALLKASIVLNSDDIISYSMDTELFNEIEINISRRLHVTLKTGSSLNEVSVPVGTVRQAFEYLKVDIGTEDILSVDLDSMVEEGMVIDLVRIEYKEKKDEKIVPYSKITTITDSLYEGESSVEEGYDGLKEIVSLQKIINGEVAEVKIISESIISSPKNQVTYIGVKPKTSSNLGSISKGYSKDDDDGTFIDNIGNTINYTSKLTGSATAYTAEPGAITSTGKIAQYGYVAVDPSIIPYGTKLYISSQDGKYVYGYATAADTGGAMLSGKRLVDLYYNSVEECYQFGVRDVDIYIL